MGEFSSAPNNQSVRSSSVSKDLECTTSDPVRLELWSGSEQPTVSPQALECMSSIQQLTRDLGMHLAGIEEISRLQQKLERQKLDMQQTIESLYDRIASLEERLDGNIAS